MTLPRFPIVRTTGPVEKSRIVVSIPPKCRERFLMSKPAPARLFEDAGFVHAGLSDLVPPYEVQRENSWHHLVIFTLGGEGRMTIDGTVRRLLPGTFCVVPAWVDHRYVSMKSWRIGWFHPARGSSWDSLLGTEFRLRPFLFGDRLFSLGEQLYGESQSEETEAREAVRLTFDLLMHYLHRELRGTESPGDREWRLKLDCLWDEVRLEPSDWTVARFAVRAGCSRSQLHVLCERLYREGPGDRLLKMRLQKAADLLLHTPWTLAQVAEDVGYADGFSFSKAFRRWSGSAPATFRKKAASRSVSRRVLDKKT